MQKILNKKCINFIRNLNTTKFSLTGKCPPKAHPIYKSIRWEKLKCPDNEACRRAADKKKICPDPPPRPNMIYRRSDGTDLKVCVGEGRVVRPFIIFNPCENLPNAGNKISG